jgi:hypothetical protein
MGVGDWGLGVGDGGWEWGLGIRGWKWGLEFGASEFGTCGLVMVRFIYLTTSRNSLTPNP